MTPKIILIVISTFFPVTVGLLDGFRSADQDMIGLLRSMGANRPQIFRHIKFPSALPQFFSGLRIAAAYSVVGAVISEWLGGFGGLGVYMTRVKKAFAFDKMFAVIFLISAISLALMALVEAAEKTCMPYRHLDQKK
jgi:ABC-type nitrate/sulfonate/bicarbonate transport system permease component